MWDKLQLVQASGARSGPSGHDALPRAPASGFGEFHRKLSFIASGGPQVRAGLSPGWAS
jgi:hypothetical protein